MSTTLDSEPTIRVGDTGPFRTATSRPTPFDGMNVLDPGIVADNNGTAGTSGPSDDAESIDVITFDSDQLPCRLHDADLWFAERPADLEVAKALCHECPLRLECLEGALERAEPWGVWGGEILDHGVVIARKRPRGRPRKNDRNDQDAPVAA